MLNVCLSLVKNRWGNYTICIYRFDSLCFITAWDWKNKSNLFKTLLHCLKVNVHQITTHPCQPVGNNFSICCYFFPCPWSSAWSAVLPLMKWVLHKLIQTRAMAGATKIIYSESAQWSDTSISSPAGDRENRGGHYNDHIAGKVRSIFYPTLTSPFPQTRTFSPGTLPFSAPLKMEACFFPQ